MLNLPKYGEKIRVWPLPGHKVQRLAEATITEGGTFLNEDGEDVVFSDHWYRRLLGGSIALTDPRGKDGSGITPAKYEKHEAELELEAKAKAAAEPKPAASDEDKADSAPGIAKDAPVAGDAPAPALEQHVEQELDAIPTKAE